MRARQQSESELPKRPPGVHEYRASLLSVFLRTDPRGDLSGTLDPERQPLPLQRAVELIHELPEEHQGPAKELAGCKLAKAIHVEGKQEFEPYFKQLVGMSSKEFKERLRDTLPTPPGDDEQWINEELLRQAFYSGYVEKVNEGFRRRRVAPARITPPQPSPPRRTPSAALSNLDQCFGPKAEPLPGTPSAPHAQSTLNLTSLVTTVDIPSTSNCDFKMLATLLDPRNWSLSPFWIASDEVKLNAGQSEFTRVTVPSSKLGESWSGHLYEHVEWNWNLSNVASFKNYLNIQFTVDAATQQLRMDFALYSCEGSQIYLLEQPGGVDVDTGFQCLAPVAQPTSPLAADFRLRTLKHIRFTDLLDRQTPGQGPAGTGQFLSYLAPAVVGLWLNELIWRLYCAP